MAETTKGRFVWRELMTSDVDAAKRFYGEVFGWSFKTIDMPGMAYTMISAGQKGVGGMMAAHGGAPPSWTSYVAVEDVDQAARTCKTLGGTVLSEPQDVPGMGRFAVLQDPTGAVSAAWRSAQPEAPQGMPGGGEFCWESLNTTDIAKAQAFYTEVYGWTVGSFGPDMPTFGVGEGMDKQVADVSVAPPGAPSHWLTYVLVGKLTEARDRAKKLGATVLAEAIAVPGIGTFSILQDPQKAIICPFEAAER